jgi:glycosyltransferase involved in cell wall biosynthesis
VSTADRDTDITVVIPTHDRARLLRRTLRAVLGQRGVRLAVVVVDDGSSDGTGAMLATVGDPRVRTVRHDRARGVSAARNAGVAAASTEWVAFCDDDDVWAPGKLAAQLAAVRADPAAGWSCTGAIAVDERLAPNGRAILPPAGGDVAAALLARNVVPGGGSTVLARLELVRDAGGFDEALAPLADWDLWIRLALRSPLAPVDELLCAYLVSAGGMAHWRGRLEAELRVVERRYAPERARAGAAFAWSSWRKYLGEGALRAGRRADAARQHARLALAERDVASLRLLAAGLVLPRQVQRRRDRSAARLDDATRRAVEPWLAELRGE